MVNRRELLSGATSMAAFSALSRKALSQGTAVPPSFTLPGNLLQRHVATRACFPCGFSPDALVLAQNTRFFDILTSRYAIDQIQVVFCNFGDIVVTGTPISTEGDNQGAQTISGSLEVNTVTVNGSGWSLSDGNSLVIPMTFGGSLSAVIPPGGMAICDPINYPFVAGQGVYVNTFVTPASAIQNVATRPLNPALFEYSDDGWFVTASGTSATATTAISVNVSGQSGVILPIKPGTFAVFSGGLTAAVTDDGAGNIPATNGVAAGSTINYTTGALVLNLTVAASPAAIQIKGYGKSGVTVINDSMNRPRSSVGMNNIASRQHYGPSAIIGRANRAAAKKPFAFGLFGDSITWGSGNSVDFGVAWGDYCIAGSAGVVKLAQPSEKASQWATLGTRRRRINLTQSLFDRAIFAYGTNDINSGVALATLQANWLAGIGAVAALLPNGINDVWAAAIIPRTVSAASQSPLNANYSSQSVAGGTPSLRNAFNAWIYTQVGVACAGIIDLNTVLENAPATQAGAGDGQHKNLALTFDGTHPNQAGNQAVAAVYGVNGSAPHPAFRF